MNGSQEARRLEIERIRREVIPCPELVNVRDEMGATPLRTAIELESLDLVQTLLSHGAQVNAAFDDGMTYLVGAIGGQGPDSLKIMEVLLDAGADLEEESGWGTPLQVAARQGNAAMVTLLLARGASVDRRREREVQETALMEAAFGGHPEVVRLLLDSGADASLVNDLGMDALAIAKKASEGFKVEDATLLEQAGLASSIDLVRTAQNELARKGRHAEVIQILETHPG